MTQRAPAHVQPSHAVPRKSVNAGANGPPVGVQGLSHVMQMQSMIGNQAVIQRKPAKLDAYFGAHMRDYVEKQTAPGQTTFEVKEKSPKGDKIKHHQEFEDLEIDDETGQWRMIQVGQVKGFIRKSKVRYSSMIGLRQGLADLKASHNHASIGSIGKAPEDDDDEGPLEFAGETGEVFGTGPEGAKDSFDELADELEGKPHKADEKEKLEHKSAIAGAVNAPMAIINPVVEGLMGIKKMYKAQSDKEKETDERRFETAEGAIDTVSGVNNFIGGMSGVVEDAGKLDGKDLDKAGGVSEWSGSVGEAIGAIKSAFFAVKDIYDLVKKVFSDEGASLDEVVSGGASAVQNLLESAKSSVDTVKSIYEIIGKSTSNLATAIPGISIAVSGISITIKVYNMIKAYISRQEMDEIKQAFKTKYGAKKASFMQKSGKGTDKVELQKRLEALRNKQDLTEDEKEELADIEEYNLSREMKSINNKRLVRGGIQVGLEMANIAGDIATLSGVGAQVGIPLKAVAAGVGASMGIFRKIKQAGHDKAAKSGQYSLWRVVFNAEKSSDKKQARRIEQANMILEMIAALPDYAPDDEKVVKQYERVKRYIAATGTSLRELFRLNGNLDKQRELLVKSMAARE